MGALPFNLSNSVTEALQQLQNGQVNWVEMYLDQETVELSQSKEVDVKEPLQNHVPPNDARYYFLYFLFLMNTLFFLTKTTKL